MINTVISQVDLLAESIESDIRQKCLIPGMRYLTAAEAGLKLGINERMASRAMSLLADRGVLVRKRRAGTFVGPNAKQRQPVDMKRISILVSSATSSYSATGTVVDSVIAEMPMCRIQVDILPEHSEQMYIKGLAKEYRENGGIAGMILLSCPLEAQSAVLTSGVPAVSFGSVYQSTSDLYSVNIDQFEAGRIACRYLLSRGNRRILFLCRDTWLPGDNLRLDGVNAEMEKAGLGNAALIVRSVLGDREVIKSEVATVLAGSDNDTGLISPHSFFADAALDAFALQQKDWTKHIVVVSQHSSSLPDRIAEIPYVWAEMDFQEVSSLVVRTLKQRIADEVDVAKHTLIPVKLIGVNTNK